MKRTTTFHTLNGARFRPPFVQREYDRDDALDLARMVAHEGYAWPGGYAMFIVTDDGALLCPKCIIDNWRSVVWSHDNEVSDGWRPVGVTSTAEMDDEIMDCCAHCQSPVLVS